MEVGEGLRAVFDRIGEFFHLFDLSFLVSGASTFSALAVLYVRLGAPRVFPFAEWVGVFALIIACYICGLMSFAVGRLLNGRWFRRNALSKSLSAAMVGHQIDSVILQGYRRPQSDPWHLYTRLWQDAAHRAAGSLTLRHLMRYWAMAATFDGLAFSFFVWGVVAILASTGMAEAPLRLSAGVALFVVFVLLGVVALWQGAKYYEYQIEDIVASLAATKGALV